AAFLYRRLIESGLGESVIGGGLDDTLLQNTFSVGLKGVKEEDFSKVEQLVLEILQDCVKEGFPADAIAASVNSIEFSLREFNTGRFPRGLSFMLGAMNHWIYDRDPLDGLRFEGPLEEIKADLAANKKIFEDAIDFYLLSNGHRAAVRMVPDVSLEEKQQKEEEGRLAQIKAGMNDEALEKIIKDTALLKAAQEAEDSPEARASLPRLDLTDLDKVQKETPVEVAQERGVTILRHALPTNGILYADIGFDVSVCLPGLVDAGSLSDPEEREEILRDLVDLCQAYGRVVALRVNTSGCAPPSFPPSFPPSSSPSSMPSSVSSASLILELGSVLVRYSTAAEAARAVLGLQARTVQGQRVRAFLWRPQQLNMGQASLPPSLHPSLPASLSAASSVSSSSSTTTFSHQQDHQHQQQLEEERPHSFPPYGHSTFPPSLPSLPEPPLPSSSPSSQPSFPPSSSSSSSSTIRFPPKYREASHLPKLRGGGREQHGEGEGGREGGEEPPSRTHMTVRGDAVLCTEELEEDIKELIRLLMSFQERARLKDAAKGKKVRRMVFGLREVMRGIRSRKIQFVVIAPDIERSPALDQEIAEI
ncbi:hypothetical protein VYU27_010147, partial [Nannochloropsis oceanica]